ncbi:unnamed protein product [Pleuronectes platessa]|uniref:Uncharacterized protein n=1 Tax=Pleuronectes platessa TaxID=8262 RepID=A0A9N7TZV1_PLEPL|nr:unnamed protein product [Pleuronectes platessa]
MAALSCTTASHDPGAGDATGQTQLVVCELSTCLSDCGSVEHQAGTDQTLSSSSPFLTSHTSRRGDTLIASSGTGHLAEAVQCSPPSLSPPPPPLPPPPPPPPPPHKPHPSHLSHGPVLKEEELQSVELLSEGRCVSTTRSLIEEDRGTTEGRQRDDRGTTEGQTLRTL